VMCSMFLEMKSNEKRFNINKTDVLSIFLSVESMGTFGKEDESCHSVSL
jgi:hypothetical protein